MTDKPYIHPAFPQPADLDAVIWRYMDAPKFEGYSTPPGSSCRALTAYTVHAYFTARYADRLDASLRFTEADERAMFTAA